MPNFKLTSPLSFLACFFLCFLATACSKDEPTVYDSIDEQLFAEATTTRTGFSWYKGSNAYLVSSDKSGHNPFMRTKFDPIAQTALGADGKLPEYSVFPNGSLIIKELYNSDGGKLEGYLVKKKDKDNRYQVAGYVWGQYNPDGTVAYSAEKRGDACLNCHSTGTLRDYSRIFDLH